VPDFVGDFTGASRPGRSRVNDAGISLQEDVMRTGLLGRSMVLLATGLGAALIGLVALSAGTLGAQKKPSCSWCGSTSAIFLPESGSVSDGTAVYGDIGPDAISPTYTDGERGLRATLEATGQWAMKLDYYRYKGTRRQAYVNFQSGTNDPVGCQTSAFYISVFGLGQMQIGDQKLTGGNGSVECGGKTYWFWFTTDQGHTGTFLRATHPSDTQWVVETVEPPNGTIAELTEDLVTHYGNYPVTFRLTINKF
jgi:hypothetical protein